MLNKKKTFLFALTAAVVLAGCGKKEAETEKPAAEDAQEESFDEASGEEEALEPITPSDYLVKRVSDYITLGDLSHLAATQTVYEVTDEMVKERIADDLYSYSEESEVEKAAEGNIVYADVTSSIQGVEDSEETESTYFTIGEADYGVEFDQKLLGTAAGDELNFSISYDEDTWMEEWADQTVDFQVKVTGVYETIMPEYDDAFVSEYTDYETKSAYEDSIREEIRSEYDEDSYANTVNTLIQEAMDQSTYNGYPEELYDSCEEEILSYYGQFIGETDTDAILETLGITQEDLESDILNTVDRRLLITAICKEQDIEVTEEEYVDSVTEDAETYGYMSAAEYEYSNGRESIVWNLYENKVAEYLYDNATITPAEPLPDDETELYEDEADYTAAEIELSEPETVE